MKAKLIHDGPQKTFVVVFGKGDEVIQGLGTLAEELYFRACQFTGIGAFSDVVLGYFDPKTKEYRRIPIKEQVEVLSMLGNIAQKGERPGVHAHVIVGRADGTTRGGHLLEGHVWPTLELILTESPEHLTRSLDPDTGLALIDLGATPSAQARSS
jgi:uncharacterized protein